ncbi:MAG: ribosome maturation factor RimP [Armatimonadetes bacterium]|nr:ribosome maturation factor RimP [Armatimonadota bacterium]
MTRKVHPIVREIEDQVREVVEGLGYELVLLKYSGPARRPTLSVFIDSRTGVTVDDCARVSERLSVLLDVLDPIPTAYELVVSSPGLERPLVRKQDFDRFVGRKASVRQVTGGQTRRLEGWLRGTSRDAALLEHEGKVEAIPLDEIEEAHLIYEWEDEAGSEGVERPKGGR